MNSFQTALSAVLPMFVMLVMGNFLKRIKMVDEHTLNKMNTLCFKTFLSISLYYNIYRANIAEVFNGKLLMFAVIAQFIILGISFIAAIPVTKGKKKRGALIHGIFHTNFVIFGTLIGTALCGEGNIGAISLLIAVIVPVQNILSVITLEMFREGGKISFKQIAKGVIKNPYVIAAILGCLTHLFGIKYPDLIANIFRDLGRCGTPVALIVMGGLFNFGAVYENIKSIMTGVVCRLIIVPAILIPISIWLGFRGGDLIGLMCIFVAPCAITSFNLASAMDSDADLAAQLVVFTSVVSIFTIFIWIFTLSQLGLI
ncbi:MAG: AEC family transporter [Fusobacterium ulcerans]|uniref:AEC family transporter n=1 Tax=Fusobacterium ulcerans TaxID=861 RepID=UPI003A87524B